MNLERMVVIDVGNSGAKIGAVKGEEVAGPMRLPRADGRAVRDVAGRMLQGKEAVIAVMGSHPDKIEGLAWEVPQATPGPGRRPGCQAQGTAIDRPAAPGSSRDRSAPAGPGGLPPGGWGGSRGVVWHGDHGGPRRRGRRAAGWRHPPGPGARRPRAGHRDGPFARGASRGARADARGRYGGGHQDGAAVGGRRGRGAPAGRGGGFRPPGPFTSRARMPRGSRPHLQRACHRIPGLGFLGAALAIRTAPPKA